MTTQHYVDKVLRLAAASDTATKPYGEVTYADIPHVSKLLRLAGSNSKPYGDVLYADPKNGKYPIDTEKHIRAAWSYINMPKNAATYPLNGVKLEDVKARVRAAGKKLGIEFSDDSS